MELPQVITRRSILEFNVNKILGSFKLHDEGVPIDIDDQNILCQWLHIFFEWTSDSSR